MGLINSLRKASDVGQVWRDEWVARIAREVPPGKVVLDVGAGTCPYRSLFAHCDYRAHDFAEYAGTVEGALRDHWVYGKLNYISDISAIPVDTGSIDVVLCTEVLEHVPDPSTALKEMGRVLKFGGRLFLSAPLGSGLHQQPHHYYGGYTPHFYSRFLPECGFRVDRIAPTGGGFSHMAQESLRAGGLLRAHYRRSNPLYWISTALFSFVTPLWFSRIDEKIHLPEFTTSYLVEATRVLTEPATT